MPREKYTHSEKVLTHLFAESTLDAYGDDVQFSGIVITLDENLPFPFQAQVVSETVEGLTLTKTQVHCHAALSRV